MKDEDKKPSFCNTKDGFCFVKIILFVFTFNRILSKAILFNYLFYTSYIHVFKLKQLSDSIRLSSYNSNSFSYLTR